MRRTQVNKLSKANVQSNKS